LFGNLGLTIDIVFSRLKFTPDGRRESLGNGRCITNSTSVGSHNQDMASENDTNSKNSSIVDNSTSAAGGLGRGEIKCPYSSRNVS
jgi:hypothetical protein